MQISPKTTKIAICGLGYVGFPVALLFAKARFKVTGVDVNEEKAKKINRGGSPIEGKEPGLKELIKKVHQGGNLSATANPKVYSEANVIIVAVETPVENDSHEPTYAALRSALKSIGQHIKKGALIIIESTIAPGTMEHVVKPVLEQESGLIASKDFLLANCPERLMPGRLLENILNYNRVLGGANAKATHVAKTLYKHIIKGEIEETDMLTAEIVKAGENTYRDVQIAFANEMALLCEALGANVWEVRSLINNCKRRGETRPDALRQMHFPGAGVGGHCIPKDPWLLVYGAKGLINTKIVPLARKINDFMPKHMIHLLKKAFEEIDKDITKAKIVILGYAYAGDSDDDRNTPTAELLKGLEKIASDATNIVVHDPFIKPYKISLEVALKNAQAIVLMTDHDQYKKISYTKLKRLMKKQNPIIIDGRNCFVKDQAQKEGFIYKGVGNI